MSHHPDIPQRVNTYKGAGTLGISGKLFTDLIICISLGLWVGDLDKSWSNNFSLFAKSFKTLDVISSYKLFVTVGTLKLETISDSGLFEFVKKHREWNLVYGLVRYLRVNLIIYFCVNWNGVLFGTLQYFRDILNNSLFSIQKYWKLKNCQFSRGYVDQFFEKWIQ